MVEQNIEDIEAFYDYINPSTLSPLVKQKDGSLFEDANWIKSKEEFVAKCLEYNQKYNCYAPYRQIKDRRHTDNVTMLKNFVIDIDNDVDGEKARAFEENYCKRYNLRIGAKICSGGGYHYYIPYRKTIIGDENRKDMQRIANSLCQNILNNKIDIDKAIFDLARLIRIWGTWNFNKEKLCKLIYINNVTDEEVEANTAFINTLSNLNEAKPIVQEPTVSIVLPPTFPLLDYLEKNKLMKENTGKNNVLIKNIAAYLWTAQGEEGYDRGVKITKVQGKSEGEFKGWWHKAQNEGFQYNNGEMYKWLKEFYPELIDLTYSLGKEKSKVIYSDGNEYFGALKSIIRGKGKLVINKEIIKKGKVQQYISNKKEEICIMQTYEVQDKTGEISFITRFLDEQKIIRSNASLSSELSVKFYCYTFNTDKGESYLLFSEEELDFGDYWVEGLTVKLRDDLLIGNYGKTESRKTVVFCHNASPLTRKYKSADEIFATFNYTKQQLLNYLFYHKAENKTYKEPEYINNLMLAYLFSGKKGYPMHLLISGEPCTGKSSMIEAINEKFDESNLDSGGASTIKNLVPSFGQSPPRYGSLLSATRICFVDEFFGNIHNETKSGGGGSQGADNLRIMNEVLEARERRYGSGKGVIEKARMKAKLLCVTNPIEGTTFEETVQKTPETVIQRILLINLGKAMVTWINDTKSFEDGPIEPFPDIYVWLGIYDFFNSFLSKYDTQKVLDIVKKYEQKVPVYMRSIYNTRYKNHHVHLILDGIVKTRCLFEKDDAFTAKDVDYYELEKLWDSIIANWNENVTMTTFEQDFILEAIKTGEGFLTDYEIRAKCMNRGVEFDYNIRVLKERLMVERKDGKYIIGTGNDEITMTSFR